MISQIQITLPNDPEDYIQTILAVLKNELKVKNIFLIKDVDNSLIIIRVERTQVPGNVLDKIKSALNKVDMKSSEIGYVDNLKEVKTITFDGKETSVLPRFRESAYMKIKQEIGEESLEWQLQMEEKIEETANKALEKRKKMIDYIKSG